MVITFVRSKSIKFDEKEPFRGPRLPFGVFSLGVMQELDSHCRIRVGPRSSEVLLTLERVQRRRRNVDGGRAIDWMFYDLKNAI